MNFVLIGRQLSIDSLGTRGMKFHPSRWRRP